MILESIVRTFSSFKIKKCTLKNKIFNLRWFLPTWIIPSTQTCNPAVELDSTEIRSHIFSYITDVNVSLGISLAC